MDFVIARNAVTKQSRGILLLNARLPRRPFRPPRDDGSGWANANSRRARCGAGIGLRSRPGCSLVDFVLTVVVLRDKS